VSTDVPSDERLELLRCAVLLLPDVHRETLQCLLLFLGDMAKHSHHNQVRCLAMTIQQLQTQRVGPVGKYYGNLLD